VHNRDTLWIVADRRLSYGGHRPPIDNAVKIMDLETVDGHGVLGYAGLGATPRGTQPSDWMSAVLRGRGGLSFEQSLGILSAAANSELPRHLLAIPGSFRSHSIIVPAFVRNVGFRLYSIDNLIQSETGQHWYRYTRYEVHSECGPRPVRIALGGTGGLYLHRTREVWQRALLSLVKAHGCGKVTDYRVADELARLNWETHHAVRDGTVGPRCIVVWRRRPDAEHAPGSGHQFYTGTERDAQTDAIPTIANGMDVRSIGGVLMQHFQENLSLNREDGSLLNLDWSAVNRQLAELPSEPDERLE
jgi:hypothetical protein